MKDIIVGTRGSNLALKQTGMVIKVLSEVAPAYNYQVKKIKTTGDRILHKALNSVGGKGLFIKEIEHALLNGEIDMAVHSLKDMPARVNSAFELVFFPEREDPSDVLISREGQKLDKLPRGARFGTGSLRRQVQLQHYRPDLEFTGIRGNVETRIRKMKEDKLEGIILAAAGIHRLGLKDIITQYLPREICIPAVGQGTLAIEIRKENEEVKEILKSLDSPTVRTASRAERGFLAALDGSCHLPIGAHARLMPAVENMFYLELTGFLAGIDGEKYIRRELKAEIKLEDAERYGKILAEEILDAGGDLILKELTKGYE